MTRAGKGTGARKLHPNQRRRLSEEGKRLLRSALAAGSDGGEDASVDYSVISNWGDSSVESELESTLQWEQQQQQQQAGRKTRGKKWKDEEETEADDLEGAMEELTEKRDTTKISALEKILTMLRAEVMSERVQSSKVTLTLQTLGCLKKRAKDSSSLALRVLSMVAITLGADEQEFYRDMLSPVQRIFTDRGDSKIRVEAVYALSIACFVCSPDDDAKWELLEVLGSFLVAAKDAEDDGHDEKEFPEALTIAVMECWAFLVSYFNPSVMIGKVYNAQSIVHGHVAALAGFVRGGTNASVRASACEVLALIVQFKYITAGSGYTYSHESAGSIISGLGSRIEAYMRESGKSIGKKNRKVQRSMLKEVLETLETGEGPHKELQAEGETLTVSTWSRFFQAHVFRRALQSGFQTHLVGNEVLRDVFEVTENPKAKIALVSTVKRRADHKAKAVHKRNGISRKDEAQNAFLFDE
ncbi:Interferon-related developmental regulator protein [Phytophthora megakarya]|uniref:Interferon-related developmental regulator protein n=1 Tax=Phytophthora megakarya TaxID=4795 RepID=A0A225VHR2_9STRA|nr:Interferon-related developmental regulator protein [Phytophthora megakarya]